MKKKAKQNVAKKKGGVEAEAAAPTADTCEASAGDGSSQERKRLRISQSDGCFLEFLNKDRRAAPSFCDIAITVCGEMYPAHKVVLAFGSSYFHAKLSENPQLDHMSFENVDASTFEHLLNFLYTSEMEVRQSQIPSLAEAACFFDMMEAVNLLAGEATPNQVPEEGKKEEELSVEEAQRSSSGEIRKPQTPGETQCSICSRTFCYKKSLENHMAKMHRRAEAVETAASSSSTRTSTRQSRSKTQSQESENCLGMENRRHQGARVDEGTTSGEEEEDEDDADDEDYANGEENRHDRSKERDQKEVEPALEAETSVRPEEDAGCRKEVESSSGHVTKDSDASVAQSGGGGGHVYPEGLAPVIIQSGNKKTLKCPKCDKTFDRIGES